MTDSPTYAGDFARRTPEVILKRLFTATTIILRRARQHGETQEQSEERNLAARDQLRDDLRATCEISKTNRSETDETLLAGATVISQLCTIICGLAGEEVLSPEVFWQQYVANQTEKSERRDQ